MMDPGLHEELFRFGAKDMEICMQCGTCSASCPLSSGKTPFPRKIYRYIQLGLEKELLSSLEPWLCYYCGECNKECPRGAEPAETMMAARRWLTAAYDATGLARRLYLSKKWETGSILALGAVVVLLFLFFHGPVITDRVSVNSFAPVKWIEIGDLLMAGILSAFLLSNAFRMARFVMGDVRAPFRLYLACAKSFLIHFATQARWRRCSDDRTAWARHFFLVTGYMTMMFLIIVCIRWFQVDDDSWQFLSIFGYYATAVLLVIPAWILWSRRKKKEVIHRFSEPTDWLFPVLLFLTALTGILMHLFRISGWAYATYGTYVLHLAIAVPMLVIEVPFGKWSHLFYRPLAVFLAEVREKALEASDIRSRDIQEMAGEAFLTCMQCGICTGACPASTGTGFSPRGIIRGIGLDSGTRSSVDEAAFDCLMCDLCTFFCPRSIDITGIIASTRRLALEKKEAPPAFMAYLERLETSGNPLKDVVAKEDPAMIPGPCSGDDGYLLFTCCFNLVDPENMKPARDLAAIFRDAGLVLRLPGEPRLCCGDPAAAAGDNRLFEEISGRNAPALKGGRIITTSPHCLDTFMRNYPQQEDGRRFFHYSQVLSGLVAEGRLMLRPGKRRLVTFHDPCFLGRKNSIYDEPRNVIKSLPGVELVEMKNSMERSICCGGGGGGVFLDDESHGKLAAARVEEALSTGADALITACPYCIRMLNRGIRLLGVEARIELFDLAEFAFLFMAEKEVGQEVSGGIK